MQSRETVLYGHAGPGSPRLRPHRASDHRIARRDSSRCHGTVGASEARSLPDQRLSVTVSDGPCP
eukprot:564224-Hanusia_phi.AAC.1